MFRVRVNLNEVLVIHKERMTVGSSGYLKVDASFTDEWADLDVWVYFLRNREPVFKAEIGSIVDECGYISILPTVTIRPGEVMIGFKGIDETGAVVIPTVWGSLGEVLPSVTAMDAMSETGEGVVSFNGRSGNVMPQTGDYNPSMVGVRGFTNSELEDILTW